MSSSASHESADLNPARVDAIDALRGAALVWMTVYHFCFDLFYFRLLATDFYRDPVWTVQRTVILSLFLACAGASQAMAHELALPWSRFWRRWAQVALCAALVSLGSWLMFPRSFIYFGVLHALLALMLLARLTAGQGVRRLLLWALGLLLASALLRPLVQASPWAAAFDTPLLNWLGLFGRKPVTEDHVPLLPWAVPVLLGLAGARWLRQSGHAALRWQAQGRWRWLTWAGRNSLSWYMLHQPILIGTLLAAGHLLR